MREIDNKNLNSLSFTSIQKLPKEDTAKEVPVTDVAEHVESSDLSKLPAASLGKSQVAADNIEADMAVLEKNPGIVKTLNAVVDDYASRHSENETIKMIEALHQEFTSRNK